MIIFLKLIDIKINKIKSKFKLCKYEIYKLSLVLLIAKIK